MIDFNRAISNVQALNISLSDLAKVNGWLSDEAADITIKLVQLQRSMNQVRGVLELGVAWGKYLSLLNALYEPENVAIVGVDGFLDGVGAPLDDLAYTQAELVIRENVRLLANMEPKLTLVRSLTRDVDVAMLQALSPGGFGFISVDAGHDLNDIMTDMTIVARTAHRDAILALDDVFNPVVPAVTEGVCRFLIENSDFAFRPFAICGNKVFLAGLHLHETYLNYSKRLCLAPTPSYLSKTAVRASEHRNLGFVPRFFGHEVAVFEWN